VTSSAPPEKLVLIGSPTPPADAGSDWWGGGVGVVSVDVATSWW
jgi:hypothetical protein